MDKNTDKMDSLPAKNWIGEWLLWQKGFQDAEVGIKWSDSLYLQIDLLINWFILMACQPV